LPFERAAAVSRRACFQRRNAGLQRLVFLAREAGHVLDRVELLALDQIEITQDALGLVADHGIDLALDALGRAGGVVHQAADLVEKPIVGLGHLKRSGHGRVSPRKTSSDKTMAIPRPQIKGAVQGQT